MSSRNYLYYLKLNKCFQGDAMRISCPKTPGSLAAGVQYQKARVGIQESTSNQESEGWKTIFWSLKLSHTLMCSFTEDKPGGSLFLFNIFCWLTYETFSKNFAKLILRIWLSPGILTDTYIPQRLQKAESLLAVIQQTTMPNYAEYWKQYSYFSLISVHTAVM